MGKALAFYSSPSVFIKLQAEKKNHSQIKNTNKIHHQQTFVFLRFRIPASVHKSIYRTVCPVLSREARSLIRSFVSSLVRSLIRSLARSLAQRCRLHSCVDSARLNCVCVVCSSRSGRPKPTLVPAARNVKMFVSGMAAAAATTAAKQQQRQASKCGIGIGIDSSSSSRSSGGSSIDISSSRGSKQ